MTVNRNVVNRALELARMEATQYGLPTEVHLDLSLQKAQEIARRLGADVNLATVGAALMDLKLGEAFAQKRLPEHVEMGVEASKQFLREQQVGESEERILLNCVAAHHGTVPFESLEAEIVANADCYRFIHPRGVVDYLGTLARRGLALDAVCDQATAKLEEKWRILSLEECKSDLTPYYRFFSDAFGAAKSP